MEQVVYFHNPDYERRQQERKRVDAVSTGSEFMEPVQMVPCIMQLHPDITVEMEDTNTCFLLDDCSKNKKWKWLCMGKIVYLCNPSGKLLFHTNAAVLLKHYREITGGAMTKSS